MAINYVMTGLFSHMGNLEPVAFDIETSGLNKSSVITIAGFAFELGEYLILNTNNRSANQKSLVKDLDHHSNGAVQLKIVQNEKDLLEEMESFATSRLDGDKHYVTAFNGETWTAGSISHSVAHGSSNTISTGYSEMSPMQI
jgi:hypothetical protein